MKISTLIITLNEERNIRQCLESVLEFSDEILVLDSFSTDLTKNIVELFPFPIRFFERKFTGYGDSKNYLENLATSEFIFSIDADEVVDDELKSNILKERSQGFSSLIYQVKRRSNYCGDWILHGGWNPDINTRLWKKGLAKWDLSEVHEKLIFDPLAPQKLLSGHLLHYSYRSLEEHLKKIESYSEKGAQRLYRENSQFSFLKMMINPVARFLRDYFLKLGFVDGKAGFSIAKLTAWEVFLKYKKLLNLQKQGVTKT